MSNASTAANSNSAAFVAQLLRFTYGIVPIVAGLDKFTNLLAHWANYLSPSVAHALPFAPETFMHIVGVIEIVAGLLVLTKPKIGSIIVALWLVLVAVSLLIGWSYVDVAVRDLVMAVGAYSLFRLSA